LNAIQAAAPPQYCRGGMKPFSLQLIVGRRRDPYSGSRDTSRTGNVRTAFFMRGATIADAAG
jgi:hypothetical protein